MLFVAVDLYIRTTQGNYRASTELFSRVPGIDERIKVKEDRFRVIEVCHYAKSGLNSARDPVASVIVMRY